MGYQFFPIVDKLEQIESFKGPPEETIEWDYVTLIERLITR